MTARHMLEDQELSDEGWVRMQEIATKPSTLRAKPLPAVRVKFKNPERAREERRRLAPRAWIEDEE